MLYVDERNVPLGSADSNHRAAHEQLLRKVRRRDQLPLASTPWQQRAVSPWQQQVKRGTTQPSADARASQDAVLQ